MGGGGGVGSGDEDILYIIPQVVSARPLYMYSLVISFNTHTQCGGWRQIIKIPQQFRHNLDPSHFRHVMNLLRYQAGSRQVHEHHWTLMSGLLENIGDSSFLCLLGQGYL